MTPNEVLEVIAEAKEAIESIEVSFLQEKFSNKYDWLDKLEDTISTTMKISERQREILEDIFTQLEKASLLQEK